MASKEAAVLSAVCKNKDIHVILGENEELFGGYTDVFTFIKEYYLRHKSVPEVSLIEGNFGSVDFPETTGASAYYLEALRDEYVGNRMESIMMKSADAKNNGLTAPERLNKMLTALSKLGQYTANVRDLDLTDGDAAADYFEKIKMIADSSDGTPGIATGFDAIDSAYPTGMAPGHSIVLMGYAQPYSEPVLTPTGWTTMGELSIGDYVVGSNGRPAQVTEIHEQGSTDVYEVEFNDFTKVRCDKNHLWSVQTRKMRQNDSSYVVKSTTDMLNLVKYDGARDTTYKYYVPLPEPVYGDSDVPTPGYLLGQLLSDGCTVGTSIQLTTNDEETIELIRLESPTIDIKEITRRSSTARQWRIYGGYIGNEMLYLKGVSASQKTIPNIYMTASIDTRYSLLRGLMDGDGSVGRHRRPTFYSTSAQLADDVASLVRSLGGVAHIKIDPRLYAYGGPGYVVTLWTPENPFGISRKADKYNCNPWFKSIKSIVRTGEMELQRCIKVDASDHLYLTTDYTVTHNTGTGKSMWSGLLGVNAWLQGYKVMVISLEMTPEEYRERVYAMMSKGMFKMSAMSRGEVDPDDFRTWSKKAFEGASDFIVVSNEGNADVTPNTIQAKIDTHKPDLIILDYLQLMTDNSKSQTMTPRMLNLSREIKLLAVNNGVAIVSISAVTDEENDKRDAPPRLGQTAWSKGIEYDAHLVIAVHRHADTDIVEIAGRKNRHGPLFSVFFSVDFDSGIWTEKFE